MRIGYAVGCILWAYMWPVATHAQGLRTHDGAAALQLYTPVVLPTLEAKTATGTMLRIESLKGHLVLLHFWATWCMRCDDELRALADIQRTWKAKGVRVLAVSEDYKGIEAVRKFYKARQMRALEMFSDPGNAMFRAIDGVGVPTTLLIGPDGKEFGRIAGAFDWEGEDAKQMLALYAPGHIPPPPPVEPDYTEVTPANPLGIVPTSGEVPPGGAPAPASAMPLPAGAITVLGEGGNNTNAPKAPPSVPDGSTSPLRRTPEENSLSRRVRGQEDLPQMVP